MNPEPYAVTTVGDCVGPDCTAFLIARAQWYRLTAEQRADITAGGGARSQARSLCSRCYHAAKANGTLDDYERLQHDGAELVAEFEHIRPGLPRVAKADRLEAAARRLGVTPSALDRALERAGVAA